MGDQLEAVSSFTSFQLKRNDRYAEELQEGMPELDGTSGYGERSKRGERMSCSTVPWSW